MRSGIHEEGGKKAELSFGVERMELSPYVQQQAVDRKAPNNVGEPQQRRAASGEEGGIFNCSSTPMFTRVVWRWVFDAGCWTRMLAW